jgi:hypothetical protein
MIRLHNAIFLTALSIFCVACTPTQREEIVVTRVVSAATQRPLSTPTPLPITLTPTLLPLPTTAVPTASSTPMPTSSPIPTLVKAPTIHPLALFDDVTPQADVLDGVQVEIIPTDDFTDLILRFTRQDEIIQESSINPLIFGEGNFYPAIGGVTLVALHDFDLDGEPEIVLDIFTHGASCCTLIVVLYYDAALTQYISTNIIARKWGLSPDTIDIDGDGRLEFLTRNEPFHYAVGGANASASMSPIQIFRYENHAIVDVTGEFPELVEQDAQLWLLSAQGDVAELSPQYLELTQADPNYWTEFDHFGFPSLIMNAYLADMIMLGKGNEGCEMVKNYYENDSCEICQNILNRYEGDFCPAYLEDVIQHLEDATANDAGSRN